MARSLAPTLLAVALLAAASVPLPEAAAYVEAKVCLKFPIYLGIGIQIDDTRCQRWVCQVIVHAGVAFATHACKDITAYPQSPVVYVRPTLSPQVPLKSFTLTVTVQDFSQPSITFADCVWSETGVTAGTTLSLDSCIREGGAQSYGPWVFNSRFESVPDTPGDPNTVYGSLTVYYGVQPGACVNILGISGCAGAP